MNRSDLISRIASQWHLLNAKDVEATAAAILSAIATKLAEGGRVEIRGVVCAVQIDQTCAIKLTRENRLQLIG